MKLTVHAHQPLYRYEALLADAAVTCRTLIRVRCHRGLTTKAREVVTSVEVLEYLAKKGSARICAMEAECSTVGVVPSIWTAR